MKAALVIVLATFFCLGESVVYSRCDLARELLRQGFARSDLDNWVCLVESESSGNTRAVGPANSDGSHDYGLFQINDRYWCAHGYNGNGCDIDCDKLIDDNITDDSKCAMKIFQAMSWWAWNGWKRQCEGKPIPNIGAECGL